MQLEDLPLIADRAWQSTDQLSAIAAAGQPIVLRGLAADWPLVRQSREGTRALFASLQDMDSGVPVDLMIGQPEIAGRFFYNEDLTGFNFEKRKGLISDVLGELARFENSPGPPAIYAGATATQTHFPGFDASHPLPQGLQEAATMSRIWLGNRVQVATHFDMSPNIAVVVAGKRRFTLFDPHATASLYVGPLHNTIAGQPVSLVDPVDPDLERFPKYVQAWELAATAVLEPGDAIYIPALWWHHVLALADINVLVNYWHQDSEHGGPFLAFIHALWSIRDLPSPHKAAWRSWFEHFIFDDGAKAAADHLPPSASLINGRASTERDEAIHGFLLKVLSGR